MGKYSEMKYSDMYEVLCKELCCEMEKFECEPHHETLKNIKDLLEAIGELQEIEAGSAMRDFAEDEWGYDMDEGMPSRRYGLPGLYNNAGRRGNGRYGGQRFNQNPNTRTGYPSYGPNRGGMYPDMPGYSDRDRMGGMDRDGRQDGRMGYGDDEPYMLRQENGKPRMTPYAMHTGTIPKKLTEDQYKEWMRDLVNADGTSGPHWTMEQTKQVQQKNGMTDVDPWVFYVAMNASYSDLCEFFTKHGLNDPKAYAEYVEAFWLDDEDSVGGGDPKAKLAAYYSSVVEH